MTKTLAGPDALRLLLVEDNPGDADLLREHLDEWGVPTSLEVRGTLSDGLAALVDEPRDAILLDLNLPDSRGLETLDTVLDAARDVPVVVLTGLADDEVGAEAVRWGAQDFLPKDEISGPLLGRTIRHAVERHRHERELRKAKSRAQSYLDIAEVLIVALDRNDRITMINPAGAELLGYDAPADLEGRGWFEVALPEEDRDRLRDVHRAFLSGEREFEDPQYQYPIVTRSGVERVLAWKTSLVRDETGKVTGTLSCGLDVTEREEARRKLQLLNEALQAARNAIIITDRDGRIEWANPAFTAMTGYTLAEALDQTPGDLLRSGAHDDAFYEDLWKTILGGEVWQGRMVNRRKDGTLYPEEQTITPVEGASGEIAHFIAVKQDVSEQVAAEEELRRTNRALRVISAANQALVWSSSEEEILEKMCRVAVEMGGYTFAWIAYIDEEDPSRIHPAAHRGEGDEYLDSLPLSLADEHARGPIATAVRTGSPVVVRNVDPAEDAEVWEREALGRGFRSKVAIPLMADGSSLGALSIYSDEPDAFDERELEVLAEMGGDLAHGIQMHRTRRRKAELEDRLQQDEKLRAVGQLAGGIAHDFNNYLTVITTLTDVLLEDSDLDAEERDDLQEIQGAAKSSARLTQQLLAFSRHQVAAIEVLDLGAAVEEMVSMLKRLLEETIRVELELADEPLPVRVDRGQLEQVIMNLAVNARDAMPDGGTLTIETGTVELTGTPPVGIEELEPGPHVVLALSDTGTGIGDEELPRIFEPFFTAKEDGTGLGLSTVYGIVKQSGGDVRVESEPGKGSRFEIFLPRQDADELTTRADSDPDSASVEGNETVVVVEDQVAVRSAVRRILERSGYDVVECGSVSDALDVNEAHDDSVALLLTDLGLPDGDGRQVAEAFLETRPGLVVLYTSGYTPQEMDFAIDLGPREHFIEKPFDLGQLARKVRSALDAAKYGRSRSA